MKRLSYQEVSEVTGFTPKLLPSPNGIERQSRGISEAPVLSHILSGVRKKISSRSAGEEEATTLTSAELLRLIEEVALEDGFRLSTVERDRIIEELEKDQQRFGPLEELVNNREITDIIVSSYDSVIVQKGRRNYATDVQFADQAAYEAFVERLLLRAGTTYSTKKPIADGMIDGFARIHVLHKAISAGGPYLTIRLNRYSSVTIDDLVKVALAPREVLTYLEKVVQSGKTLLIVGEVGAGKTTLARALAGGIPHDESILVIEDTPEIKLAHPNVRYVTTREANTDGAGRVAPHEVIRAGMRMAMNRIIFGEMRDAEAAEAFIDVCASGHPGLSTIHARSAAEAITRLELFLGRAQRGVAQKVLSEQIVTAVSVIVFVDLCKVTGRRRVIEVREIGPVADGTIRQREIFRYDVKDQLPTWRIVNKVSAHRDILESGPAPLSLARLGEGVDLGVDQLYSETVQHKRGGA